MEGVETLELKQETIPRFFHVQQSGTMPTHEAPHIGHLIKEELARQERTVAWLARKLCCSRQNVYHLFECQWLNMEILSRLCDILNRNFFQMYSDYWESKKL